MSWPALVSDETDSGCIDDIEAVETNRTFQVARADQISLMSLIG